MPCLKAGFFWEPVFYLQVQAGANKKEDFGLSLD